VNNDYLIPPVHFHVEALYPEHEVDPTFPRVHMVGIEDHWKASSGGRLQQGRMSQSLEATKGCDVVKTVNNDYLIPPVHFHVEALYPEHEVLRLCKV
jgi:hypothetical protein